MGSDPIALPVLDLLTRGPAEVVAVYTQPDRATGRGQRVQENPIKRWALDQGIEVRQPLHLTESERISMEALAPDLVMVMAYGHLLRQAWLDTPRAGIFNLHTSLLPRYRGASPIQATVLEGDAEGGVTLMRLVLKMDAGPLVDHEKVVIGPTETAGSLEEKLSQACVPLVERNLESLLSGEARLKPQDPSRVSFTRKLRKTDGVIDFSQPADVLVRRINGLYPWPGVQVPINGVTIRCGLADHSRECAGPLIGTVLEPDRIGLRIATGSGLLRIRRLQRPGGRMLDGPEFLRGFPVAPGTVLESRPMPRLVANEPLRG
ncbi:MAG: methionyl-tRNA formyltransferase [Verrucomicrobia bacterium]|nr:MAG: methionyl-tRNA formyltransferase [Verrucomicrobiota bacterium]